MTKQHDTKIKWLFAVLMTAALSGCATPINRLLKYFPAAPHQQPFSR